MERAAPAPTRLGRLRVYVAEMFPPLVHVPASAAGFYAAYFLGHAAASPGPVRVTAASVGGAATVLLVSLLLRVFDELKDLETDRVLFKERPVPSGRVTVADLKALMGALLVSIALLNAFQPRPVLIAFLGVLGFAFLTFRYFFIPGFLRTRVVWLLITHQPLVPLVGLYAVISGTVAAGGRLGSGSAAVVLIGWLPALAWELSRKIRAPEQEDAYVTYSRVFGTRGAALAALAPIVAAAALAPWLGRRLDLGWGWVAPIVAAAALAVLGFGRFLARPSPASAKLRPFAEVFAVAFYFAAVLGVGLARGVRPGG